MWQRWEPTAKIFEKSSDDGGSWTPLGLDAAIITQGTFAAGRLPATVMYTNAANVVSVSRGIQLETAIPSMDFKETGAAADAKYWNWLVTGGKFYLQKRTDAYAGAVDMWTIDRSTLDMGVFGNIVAAAAKALYTGSVAAANLRYYWDATGCYLRMGAGGLIVFQNSAATTMGEWTSNSTLIIGVPVAEPGEASIVLPNNKSLWGVNAAGSAVRKIVRLDGNDIPRIGRDDANEVIGIPVASGLPAASANRTGGLFIDQTNNRLCYYVGANRYYLAGTAF